ncbi:sugar phosphate isomerase/epimerase family protein [Halegenticoccus soli]|uniref:sugar phosphate isomerase/epimerase family protein n=1 Tax=Halegenticoccus soli TaxID=1985678 RepID=UPI000C6D879D|nr:sugar phosphate isomerase/epimerase family protein [Halegenticoccus soli]
MKFALNQVGFPYEDLLENLSFLADAGYDGVEPNVTADGPLWDDDRVAAFAAEANRAGVGVPAVSTTLHWEFPLSSPDGKTRDRGVEIGERMIEVAARVGAEAVLIVPGVVDGDTPYDEAYDRGLEAVRTLARRGSEYGVTIAVENVWNDFLLSPLEFASFVDAAAEAGPVGAYFDAGNVRRFGRPEQWIRILGDRVARIHVKDYRTDVDTIEGFTYPLQGNLAWGEITRALADVGYDGWITAEVPPYETYPDQMPPQLLANLRRIFA